MSLLDVLKYPNPKLKEKSKPIEKVQSKLVDFIQSLFETMYHENGIGLASPQVGELIRVVVVDVPTLDEEDSKKAKSSPIALINPEIIAKSGAIQYEEGCLSCPELIVKVDRSEIIRVNYLDENGKPSQLEASGLQAVCIQHEIDHLNGVLLADRLARLERDMYKSSRVRVAQDENDLKKIL